MGLPRSSLVKPKPPPPLPTAVAVDVEIEVLPMEALRTHADSVEVATTDDDPSAFELVERAAALGPLRTTWESFVLPDDPILTAKLGPHVAERRARLTRMVKMTLGGCLALCVVALGISAVSADPSQSVPASEVVVGKTVPSKGTTPIETIDASTRAKAVRRAIPAATTATVAVRPGKRR
ncbi:MAG: hypothetical protein KF819_18555 [Labilithrix sp.]|nr:hypothetical protein [Labilithrix sp.]